jgi:hypothetical protein
MQNTHYHIKHHRGSSPPPGEIQQGFVDWVSGLRSIEQYREEQLTTRPVEKQGGSRKESAQQQSDDEARWQDDGGESG